ncbi:MAG: STAS domain-containing protein [Verrucomicrobiota bacterium]
MNIQNQDSQTSVITGLQELTAGNATQVRDEIRAALPASTLNLELDLSGLTFLDSSGLGTLISLHKTMRSRNGTVRLLKPAPNVMQILELTRLHRVFEIVNG